METIILVDSPHYLQLELFLGEERVDKDSGPKPMHVIDEVEEWDDLLNDLHATGRILFDAHVEHTTGHLGIVEHHL